MRLLITTDTIGGVWTFTHELSRQLLKAGHDVLLFSLGGRPDLDKMIAMDTLAEEHKSTFRYEWSDAPLEWMQNNDDAFAVGASHLLPLTAGFQPDLLLLSQFCFGSLDVDIPRLVVAHSDVLTWASACGEQRLDLASPWKTTYLRLVENGLRHADGLIAPTRAYLEQLHSHFPGLPVKQRVIPNGISFTNHKQGTRKLQAITAGRLWDKAKGTHSLGEITSPFPLLVVGDAGDQAIATNAVMLGARPHDCVLQYFHESSIYLCMSFYEPFGLAPLEAALCGCAVVARDIATLREVWGDGALYFQDASTLTSILLDLAHKPSALAAARQRSYQSAQTYSAERMTDAYLALAAEVIAHHERGAIAA